MLMPKFKSKKGFFYLLGFLLSFALLLSVYSALKNQRDLSKVEQKDIPPKNVLQVEEPVIKIAKEIKEKSFEELKKTTPEVVKTPNISDANLREKILKEVKNTDPQNYRLFFDGKKEDVEEININQGDFVTWVNNSADTPMKIEGKDNWGSLLEIPPSKGFTQEFNFKGTFIYTVNGTFVGKVIVN